jgi:hypothetical protein
MAIHLTPESNPVVQEGTLYVDSATGEFNVAGRTTPHIIPGVLYPAVAGKLLDGSTSHSGNYGTAQTDGRSYYYTDIKGSKPIKDPRIGGHFGSQRQKLKSLQKLEQETATHGQDVYSVDGREWIRATGTDLRTYNDTAGNFLGHGSGTSFFEIVGYFSDVNYANTTTTNERDIQVSVDGGSVTTNTVFNTSVVTPLSGRYVDACSFANLGLGLTLGIHTLKINVPTGEYSKFYAIELIAQDTSNRNNIQIPSQNVVSYGKKFNVSAEGSSGHHYNPFNGYTATTSFSSVVDVDTSLGLEAWKHTDNNYYPPVNGGRVVKWVDSSGTIKTSVTLMPPNATGIGSFSSNPRDPNYGSWSSQYQPTFKNETERQLHEVAKTFHWREFGNGSANGDTGYADASMLSVAGQEIAYVMDDGLTSFSAQNASTRNSLDFEPNSNNTNNDHNAYFTFIGTGLTLTASQNGAQTTTVVQNLPYGTHVYNHFYQADSNAEGKIDGVALGDTMSGTYGDLSEVTFHQPKRPPIPEDACVIADYMLMADFVAQSTTVVETAISKGVRVVSGSRDHFIDGTSTFAGAGIEMGSARGFQGVYALRSGVAQTAQLPFFGTRFLMGIEDTSVAHELTINGTSVTEDVYDCSTTTGMDLKGIPTANVATLGVNTAKVTMHGSNSGYRFWGTHVDSPIHTSSHYQSFETPFLHELVGGDRNMEQTNLVVSPDGKTWDEVTRDTSYLGNLAVCTVASDSTDWGTLAVCDAWRGTYNSVNYFNKYFAISYGKMICLVDGQYEFTAVGRSNTGGSLITWNINGTQATATVSSAGLAGIAHHVANLKKGDVVAVQGEFGTDSDFYNVATIKKV